MKIRIYSYYTQNAKNLKKKIPNKELSDLGAHNATAIKTAWCWWKDEKLVICAEFHLEIDQMCI